MNTASHADHHQMPFTEWMVTIQERVEAALALRLPPDEAIPARLHRAMRYSCLNGGKRIRPLLAFAAGELCQADPNKLDAVSCAVEMIHAYSLVHDDLPCMDDDAVRRGKPSCHKAFGEAEALLAGDGLLTLAFEVLAETPADAPVEARIAGVDAELGLVILDQGARQGVRYGLALTVLRERRRVARIRVVDVRENIAGAAVEETARGEYPQTGDRAALMRPDGP